jgi:carbamoyl-phosphate synthase large subunit
MGIESILMNCNPETVSTDYDIADRLYFEPLTLENVMEVVERERPEGVILQFGGQTPLRLARPLEKLGVPVLGTSADSIDLAEDRLRFGGLAAQLGIPVPEHGIASTEDEAIDLAARIGYPVMVRPSYVLGGSRMLRLHDESALRSWVDHNERISPEHPVFLDRFLAGAIEIDVDALCDGASVWIAGIQQHVEMAGIHSGDSTCVLPADRLDPAIRDEIRESSKKIGLALSAVGLLNIQFAVRDGRAYVLEANPRAARTVPYVSKAIGLPLASLATHLLLGAKLADLALPEDPRPPRCFIKMPVFPFRKFPGADAILGPEMRSTGEVLGIASGFGAAFAKACAGAGVRLSAKGTAFLSVNDVDKPALTEIAIALSTMEFELLATAGTAAWLRRNGISCATVFKVNEGHPHIVDRILSGHVDLIVNTPLGRASFYDEKAIRFAALERGVSCITTIEGARAATEAIRAIREGPFEVESLQEIHGIQAREAEGLPTREEPSTPERAGRSWTDRLRPFSRGETSRPSSGHQGGT